MVRYLSRNSTNRIKIEHVLNDSKINSKKIDQKERRRRNFSDDSKTLDVEIFETVKYLLKKEEKYILPKDFLERGEVTQKMRMVLVDWIVKVHEKLCKSSETLQIAIRIMDQFLYKMFIEKNRVQLLVLTCLYIAAKYEEVNAPISHEYVLISDSAFTKKEMFQMETLILATLEFEITMPIPLVFTNFLMQYIQIQENVDDSLFFRANSMAQYFLEICLLDNTIFSIRPSRVSLAVMLIALNVTNVEGINHKSTLKKDIMNVFNVKRSEFSTVLKLVANIILQKLEQQIFMAIKEKYESTKFGGVSKLIDNRVVQKIRLLI